MSSIIKIEVEKENFYELSDYELKDFIHEIYKQNLIKEVGVEEDWMDEEARDADYYVSSTFFNLGWKLIKDLPYWARMSINPDKAPFLRLENSEKGTDPHLFEVKVLNRQGWLIAKFYFYTELNSGFGYFETDKDFLYGVEVCIDLVARGEIKLEDI